MARYSLFVLKVPLNTNNLSRPLRTTAGFTGSTKSCCVAGLVFGIMPDGIRLDVVNVVYKLTWY